MQRFLVFNGPNRSGAGAEGKNFKMLEPELDLEPKKLDSWSWSRSPKCEFWLHRPDDNGL